MKTPITLLSIIACAGFVSAQCPEGSCDVAKTQCSEGGCEMTADGGACCETSRADTVMAKGDVVYVAVDGMTCAGCSGKVTKALEGMEGVTVHKVCHKSGSAKVVIDSKKTDHAAVSKAITDSGFKVMGDIVTMKVDGMSCGECSGKLTKALDGMDGVTVKSVCHKSGTATLVKTEKVEETAIAKTVVDTGFTVKK